MCIYLVKFEDRFATVSKSISLHISYYSSEYWQMYQWVKENLDGIVIVKDNYAWFELEEDVIAFILKWQ